MKTLRNWEIGLLIAAAIFFIQNPRDGTSIAKIMGVVTALCSFGAIYFAYLQWKINKKLKSSKSSRKDS